MFVIPVGDRVDWKHPPVVTIILILLNVFVFFVLQRGDERIDERAAEYYFSTDLPTLELPRYAGYLEARGKNAEGYESLVEAGNTLALAIMEQDAGFMRELHAGRVITPADGEYREWLAQRGEYEARLARSFTRSHLFEVDGPKPLNALTAAFLHAGFGHLLGNMVVLFLVGFLVEAVIGRGYYTVAYLAAALGSAYFFAWVHHGSGDRLVGASGAIAGVMGLYTVIFGLRKIDFFYSLGFYFDYVRAPAIALLPLWLGNELYQFYSEHGARVAYMGHFGGLLSGAAMGAFYRWWRPALIESRHAAAESGEMDRKAFQRGLELLGAMEFTKAVQVFEDLLEKHPDDPRLARQAYLAARFDPAADAFHRAARRLLALPGLDAAIHENYRDYAKLARPSPRLGSDLCAKLALRFAAAGHGGDAEKLARDLLMKAPRHPELPAVLLALARWQFREGRPDEFRATLERLLRRFPGSSEARIAETLLRTS